MGEKAKGSKAPDRLTVADDGRAGAGGQIVRPRASPCLSPAAAAASPRKCACVANIRTGGQYGRGRTRCLSAANALGRCYNSLGGSAGSERAGDSFSSALPCRRLSLPPSLPPSLANSIGLSLSILLNIEVYREEEEEQPGRRRRRRRRRRLRARNSSGRKGDRLT